VHAAIARGYERDKRPFKRLLMNKQAHRVDPTMMLRDPFKERDKGRGNPSPARDVRAQEHDAPATTEAVPTRAAPRAPAADEPAISVNMVPDSVAAPAGLGDDFAQPRGFGGVPQPAVPKEETWRPPDPRQHREDPRREAPTLARPKKPAAPTVPQSSRPPAPHAAPSVHPGFPAPVRQSSRPPAPLAQAPSVHPPMPAPVPQSTRPPARPDRPPSVHPPLPPAVTQSTRPQPPPAQPAQPWHDPPLFHEPPGQAPALAGSPEALAYGVSTSASARTNVPDLDRETAPGGARESDAVFDPLGVLGGSIPPDSVLSTPSSVPPPSLPFPKRHSILPETRSFRSPPRAASEGETAVQDATGGGQFLEMLRVLVGMLENDRDDLRGHSALVARLALEVCERIKLPKKHKTAVVIASYLHDLGKMATHHITALNASQFPNHKQRGQKLVHVPRQLTESVGLPEQALEAIEAMYEQVGGRGFPKGLSGKEIPIAARILAIADTYADLTRNPRNPFARVLTGAEAIAVLRDYAGTVFDGNLIEVFAKAAGGEQILTELLADRQRVLIVDPDPEETIVLQLRLVEQGFDVHVAHWFDDARASLTSHSFAAVLCEIDLDERDAGFQLRGEAMAHQPNVSWVFLSSRGNRTTAQRAFDLDADDLLIKPVSPEVVVAKLAQLIERREARMAPRGVSGSLAQMGLTEIVQILSQGRKTCALSISHNDARGEIHFRDGRIVQALWPGFEGEQAFYRMIALREQGEFRVDPGFQPSGGPIDASPEHLLLESMRLMDEGLL
jgi:response regulator RpfG family c-di-GMP phosphodiesterase